MDTKPPPCKSLNPSEVVMNNATQVSFSEEPMSTESLYDHLNKVSRSFAITIPLMSGPLKDCVSLAYLLCRIVDTVEDDAKANTVDKITWLSDISFLAGDDFADKDVLFRLKEKALELCSEGSNAEYVALLHDMDKAVNLLETYDDDIKEIVCHAVAILAHGMASNLRKTLDEDEKGICNLDDVDNYCYFVAGVIGEMLAELFALYNRDVNKNELMELAVSFGEGLQLINILRDRAKDAQRGALFLPVKDEQDVLEYVALTQGHLDDAINFICALPVKDSSGSRMFCLTNVCMALLLLRQVSRDPMNPQCDYRLTRAKVKRIFVLCRLAAHSNTLVRALSFILSAGMRRQRRSVRRLRDKVSIWDHSSNTN